MEFKNPYLDTPSAKCSRSTLIIPYATISEVKKYEPKDGAIQTTVSILLEKLLHELARIKLDVGDRFGYQAAVCNARITLCDSKGEPLVIPEGVAESGSTVTKPTTGSKHRRTKQAVG